MQPGETDTDEGESMSARPQKVVDKLGTESKNKGFVCGSCYRTREMERKVN